MQLVIPTSKPFAFDLALEHVARFPPTAAVTVATPHSLTAAVAIDGRAWPFTLSERGGRLVADVPDGAPAELARHAADFFGAGDDLTAFYAAARTDRPFAPILHALHGLHHVRFLGLPDIAVHCVLMQRTPVAVATRLKLRFLERFGLPVELGGHTLRAVPELAALAELDGAAIGAALRHPGKGERIAGVVRGVAALGEDFLRHAPYAEARDALLAIPGVGPFSAGAILLRGLGRMDGLPSVEMFEQPGRAIYGRAWDPDAIARRYGDQLGYWSFYLMTGAPRVADIKGSGIRAGSSRS